MIMEITTYNTYKKIVPSDGMVLTDWKEGDDILAFSYAKVAICPLNRKCDWREITQDECDKLIEEQEKMIFVKEGDNV